MIDKTFDVENPMDLPYRFAHSPVTDEVFLIGIGHGFNVIGYFENRPAFHRFVLEGIKTDALIQEGILKEATDMLKDKPTGGG